MMEDNNLHKIYSKKAIFGFSVAMSSLFGGILLYINLRVLNKKKESYIVLITSIILTILTLFIVNIPETRSSPLAYICGAVGGSIYNYYFIPKYVPNEEIYPKKAIWKPLIIAILIVALFVSLMVYNNGQNI